MDKNLSRRKVLLLVIASIVASLIASMVAFPVLYGQSPESESQRIPTSQQVSPVVSVSYSGEVTYWIHGGKSGRIWGASGGSTTSTTLVLMPTDMQVIIKPATTVKVEVTLSVELAVTADVAAGVLAVIGTLPMYPNVGGPGSNYLAGYVAHPRIGAVGDFSKLESWTFTWERIVPGGTHTIKFYWAVSSSTGRVWGDFFATSVWATKTVP